jgi:hypothetical protein
LVELAYNQQIVEIIRESSLDEATKVGEEVSLSIKSHKINVFSDDGLKNLILKG